MERITMGEAFDLAIELSQAFASTGVTTEEALQSMEKLNEVYYEMINLPENAGLKAELERSYQSNQKNQEELEKVRMKKRVLNTISKVITILLFALAYYTIIFNFLATRIDPMLNKSMGALIMFLLSRYIIQVELQ